MPAIRISARAIIRRGDRFLVVRYRDSLGPWYVFPGGGQNHNEDLHQALLREVQEETGVVPTIGPLRAVRECIAARHSFGILPENFHQVEVHFDCTIPDGPVPGGTNPDANQEGIAWHTIAELRTLRFFPQPILDELNTPNVKYLGAC